MRTQSPDTSPEAERVLMERSARMTVVGSLVLLLGAALVFGAVYYKTNKTNLDALAGKLRLKLAAWQ